MRLEALADPSLVKDGPGRAANGNFALTDVKVDSAPRSPTPDESRGRAADERAGHVRAEGPAGRGGHRRRREDRPGPSIPQFGKDHAAVFESTSRSAHEGGTTLTFTLQVQQQRRAQHRPAAAVADRGRRARRSCWRTASRKTCAAALDLPAEQRTAEQTAAALKWYRTLDRDWRELNQAGAGASGRRRRKPKTGQGADLQRRAAARCGCTRRARTSSRRRYFLRRGDPDQKEGVATQGFLQVLMPRRSASSAGRHRPPAGARTSLPPHGAGQLAHRRRARRRPSAGARDRQSAVAAHLGRGIVATPSDFGMRGEPPTHPELLDWLAGELIRNGWQLKPIHKLIMTSAVYQQDLAGRRSARPASTATTGCSGGGRRGGWRPR